MIVEEEQYGENRAAYGKKILQELSEYLSEYFGKGFSVSNMKNIRQFYKVYSADRIGETVFSQFENVPAVDTGRKFYLKNQEDSFLFRWEMNCFFLLLPLLSLIYDNILRKSNVVDLEVLYSRGEVGTPDSIAIKLL